MKFRAHETFSIRKGWLHKGIKGIINNPRLFVDKNINAQDELGIGSNMVKSLRYWLQATGLTKEVIGKGMSMTEIGKIIWKYDEYFEEDGTLFLIHYMLSSNLEMATSWYLVFNEIKSKNISKKDFFDYVKYYVQEKSDNKLPSERVLNDDFECVIKTYYNSKEYSDPENNFSSPLSELGLITISADELNKDGKVYLKTSPKRTISPYLILAIIINEANKHGLGKEIRIASLETDKCNIGRTFNLDNILISNYLDKLQNMDLIKVVRTAGLDVIRLKTDLTFENCVQKYYESIK